MIWRYGLSVLVLALLGLLGWWGYQEVDAWLSDQVWASWNGEKWAFRYGPGWGFLAATLPGLLLGLAAGAWVTVTTGWPWLRRLSGIEAEAAVADRERQAAEREERAERRIEAADQRIQEAEAREAEVERRVQEGVAQAHQEAQQARAERDRANRIAHQWKAKADDAERRLKNAAGATERRRRKDKRATG